MYAWCMCGSYKCAYMARCWCCCCVYLCVRACACVCHTPYNVRPGQQSQQAGGGVHISREHDDECAHRERPTLMEHHDDKAITTPSLRLSACHAALCQDKQHGFLLFHAEKGEAARARLSHASSVVSPAAYGASSEMPTAAAAAKAETVRVASEQLVSLSVLIVVCWRCCCGCGSGGVGVEVVAATAVKCFHRGTS